ncbi:MAG: hypothetical protein ACRCYU_05215 [Nocardioides sp.]
MTASFSVLLILGIITLWMADRLKKPKIARWLDIVAAILLVGAGSVGATGIAGATLEQGVSVFARTADRIGESAVGGGFMWAIGMGLTIWFFMAVLPLFDNQLDRPTILLGLILPSIVQFVPGPTGDLFRMVVGGLGGVGVDLGNLIV